MTKESILDRHYSLLPYRATLAERRQAALNAMDEWADTRSYADPFNRIIQAVAVAFGVRASEIIDRGRKQSVCEARMAAMAIVKSHLGLSFPEVAERFNRDYTTIYYSMRANTTLASVDKRHAGRIAEAVKIINVEK